MKHLIAKILHLIGLRYKASSNIFGDITYGYGELGDYGDWEYPLYCEDLCRRKPC